MSPARTLHLTNAWHRSSGGIRTFYRALLAQAAAEGRQMTLVVPSDRTRSEVAGPGCRVVHLKAPQSPVFDRSYRLLLPHRYLRPATSDICRILAEDAPDVVEICDKYALAHLAGLIKRRAHGGSRPTLVGLSCERMDDNVRAWMPRLPGHQAFARRYMRHVYVPQFDAHIANSHYTAEELRAAVGPKAPPVFVCPMGVDTVLFQRAPRSSQRAALMARARANPGDALLLYAGRLSPEKNVALLPAVAEALERRGVAFRLIIAGEGPSLAGLRRVAGPRVSFYGHVASRDELADLLVNVDLFVHPNPREPFGIGPLEAMAARTPVVVPDAGGVREYATSRNAWMTAAEPGAMADTIVRALSVRPLAAARAFAGVETAQAHAWPDVASRLLGLYDHIHRRRLRVADDIVYAEFTSGSADLAP